MGKKEIRESIPFTSTHVKDKALVIKMLQFEENLAKNEGQLLYGNPLNNPLISLTVEKIFNRITLTEFNFDTDDTSVETFRTIFSTYYNSPNDYDKDVINASYYMRNNKCMFYKEKDLMINDTIPNCELYNLDGKTTTSLYDVINENPNITNTMICGFSLS